MYPVCDPLYASPLIVPGVFSTLLLLLLLLLLIFFMQGIYNYIPETNHASRVYSVTAIL
jgi:hypothetical protein